MQLITRLKNIPCVFLISTILLSGCAENDARKIDPEKIANDFAREPEISVTKYRELWALSPGTDEISLVDRITIAGELIKYDKQRYSEYYRFIVSNVSSGDEIAASAAANALRNAQGPESIELLFGMLKSDRPVVSRAAAHAVNYRLVTLRNSSDKNDEYLLMSRKIVNTCSDSSTPNYVRSVLCTSRK